MEEMRHVGFCEDARLSDVLLFVCLPVDFAKIPSRTFNFLRRSVSREGSREGSPHVSSGYASGKTSSGV